ncbi:MAG: hypothetical protein A2091_12435 [Desulfuromonadales bacterium GWD2_61_12]|nr:MAG: hypothetical protein A2005_10465 [Desulfuromonadales bacterium GWC2_61_20]OGR35867.1 MAG: hypothetical protein A2091_12435 [Desulfuromonadales bacterium GWD2_61_12]HAD03953.1 hypothetical protein [Desulfuromonas sp.]HBT84095.1 hypothetical protein [Desulfuromonas sp.]
MNILVISRNGRLRSWLDLLAGGASRHVFMYCSDATEAFRLLRGRGSSIDWLLVEGAEAGEVQALAASLAQAAGRPLPVAFIDFAGGPTEGQASPALLCVIENRKSGRHILNCLLVGNSQPPEAPDANVIFDFQAPCRKVSGGD